MLADTSKEDNAFVGRVEGFVNKAEHLSMAVLGVIIRSHPQHFFFVLCHSLYMRMR